MKRILCTLLALLLLIPAAFAEEIDLSGMTVQELQELRDRIDAEIARKSAPQAGEILYEDDDFRLVYLSYDIMRFSWGVNVVLNLEWTNLTDHNSCIGDRLKAKGFADGFGVYPQVERPYKLVSAGIVCPQEVTCDVRDQKQTLELTLYSGVTNEVYRVYNINLR